MTSVVNFSSPVLYDKIAQELNVELNKLGHIDDLYPVARAGFESDESFPEIYVNDGTKINFRILPDSTRSMSFFIVTGDMEDIDMAFSVPMAYIVWMNLTLVDPSKQYDYTAEIIRDVYNVLDAYGCYEINVDINTPFEGFSLLEKEVNNNTMRPYSAFRCNFTKTVEICN